MKLKPHNPNEVHFSELHATERKECADFTHDFNAAQRAIADAMQAPNYATAREVLDDDAIIEQVRNLAIVDMNARWNQ